MIYLLIFFLDEGQASRYGSPVKPSIQGITYRPILLAALSSRAGQFSILSLYALDPRRAALLLLGGDKTGDPKWYNKSVPIADDLFDHHLKQLEPKRPR